MKKLFAVLFAAFLITPIGLQEAHTGGEWTRITTGYVNMEKGLYLSTIPPAPLSDASVAADISGSVVERLTTKSAITASDTFNLAEIFTMFSLSFSPNAMRRNKPTATSAM